MLEKTETVLVADVSTIINQAVLSSPVVIPISTTDKIYYGRHLSQTYLMALLPELRLRVAYTLLSAAEPDIVVPVWMDSSPKTPLPTVLEKLIWKPPEGVTLWMIFTSGIWYLIATVQAKNEDGTGRRYMRRMPMGNMYSDAKLCMGDEYEPLLGSVNEHKTGLVNLVAFVKASQAFLQESNWNGDLAGSRRRPDSDSIFRWRLADKTVTQIVPELKIFLDNTKEISGPFAECLMLAMDQASSFFRLKVAPIPGVTA